LGNGGYVLDDGRPLTEWEKEHGVSWQHSVDHQHNNEPWDYQNTPEYHQKPILYNYLRYTYARVAEEEKIELSHDGLFVAFNTGLVTPNQEPIFALFTLRHYPKCKGSYRDDAKHNNLPGG
jgi:hypothetical protein